MKSLCHPGLLLIIHVIGYLADVVCKWHDGDCASALLKFKFKRVTVLCLYLGQCSVDPYSWSHCPDDVIMWTQGFSVRFVFYLYLGPVSLFCEDYQNCSFLYCVGLLQLYTVISTHIIWAVLSSYRCTIGLLGSASDLGLVKGFLCIFVCFTYLGSVCLFRVLVYFLLSDCLERLVSEMTCYVSSGT